MAILGFLAFMAFSVAHTVAGFLGIQGEWGTAWAWGAIAVALIFRFTLPISIGAFFGALNVWHWHWTFALLMAAPGLAFVVPGVIAAVFGWAKSSLAGGSSVQPRRPSITDSFQRREPTLNALTHPRRESGSSGVNTSALDEAMQSASALIVSGYRNFALQSGSGSAPTAKTSDKRLMEIYQTVGTAFQETAMKRGESMHVPYLNYIVLHFLAIEESHGPEFLEKHLRYQTEKYLNEGLRPDYRQELHLF